MKLKQICTYTVKFNDGKFPPHTGFILCVYKRSGCESCQFNGWQLSGPNIYFGMTQISRLFFMNFFNIWIEEDNLLFSLPPLPQNVRWGDRRIRKLAWWVLASSSGTGSKMWPDARVYLESRILQAARNTCSLECTLGLIWRGLFVNL